MEYEELVAAFFMAYFYYGKIKYGTKGHSEERLGSIAGPERSDRAAFRLPEIAGRIPARR